MNKPRKRKEPVAKPNVWTKKDTKRVILISSLFLIVICSPFLGLFDVVKNRNIEEYTGYVQGTVLSVKDNNASSQGYKGGNIVTVNYRIEYTYNIADKEYIGNCTFPFNGRYVRFYNELFPGKKLSIIYKENHPEESMIFMN